MEQMMTVQEIADILQVPQSRIYDRWREWELPMYRVGQQLRCDRAEFKEWIKNQRIV